MHARHPAFEPFEPAHLEGAAALSRQAGWPHRREDWGLVLGLSRGVVACDDAGRVIATALVTPYGPDCATVNMVIVDENWRGRGLGRAAMEAAMDLAGPRPLRLVATIEGLPLYEKLGFRATGEVRQHQGVVGALAPPPGVVATADLAAKDLAELTAADAAAFGAARGDLMRALAGAGRIAVRRDATGLDGFAVLRPFGRGEVIGPVVARSAQGAEALVGFWISQRPGAFLRVDTTAAAGLSPWLEERGLAGVGGGVAMRRDGPAQEPGAAFATFALANQALG